MDRDAVSRACVERGRLVRVRDWDSRSQLLFEETYTYDVLNRRIAVTTDLDGAGANAAITRWTAYDRDNAYVDFGDAGVMTARYLNGHAMDQRFARFSLDVVAFYLTDNVNSVRMIVSPTGAVQWTGHYTAFGTLASSSGPGGDRFTFTGRELDATGQYYYRARYYGAGIGRFTSEDPIGFTAGDTNLYRYVGNGSLTATDPTGLWSWGDAILGGGIGGAVVGGVIIAGGPVTWIGGSIIGGAALIGGYLGGTYARTPAQAAAIGLGVGACICSAYATARVIGPYIVGGGGAGGAAGGGGGIAAGSEIGGALYGWYKAMASAAIAAAKKISDPCERERALRMLREIGDRLLQGNGITNEEAAILSEWSGMRR